MALLDGKYEVMAQRPLEGGRTLFEAAAPDGTPLRVEWFELPEAQDPAFERYRRVLKRLKREGRAAVHDVISRPGARYVAWLKAPANAAAAADETLSAALAAEGFDPRAADVRRVGRQTAQLYGLGFDGLLADPLPTSDPQPPAARRLRDPADPLGRFTRLGPLAGLGRLAHMGPRSLSWVLTGALALLTVFVGLIAWNRLVEERTVVLPDLAGSQVQQAVNALAQLGFEVMADGVASAAPIGTVIDLEPPSGSELRRGRSVRLRYALPPGQLAPTGVPALVGLAYPGEVEGALWAAGLVVGEVARINAPSPAGIVIAQSLPSGSRAGTGSEVSVLVSAGPMTAQTFVPDLVGMRIEEARSLALLAGIAPDRIHIDEVTAPTRASGVVLSQSLAPNVPVSRDQAALRLVVSTGGGAQQAQGGAPDLVGMSLDEAELLALNAGWMPLVTRVASLNLPNGMIVAQTPQPGLGERGALELTLNVHPVRLTAPDVRVELRELEPREFAYAWTILPGIGATDAQVWATTLDGTRTLVATWRVSGGEVLRGSWTTADRGPVTFELVLGGSPYGERLLVP
ncbi:MAG: PASTA domain-containing protein [Trueperaceae bacterium]|nr:PASTA domain-containing protein [Trueperaceae bacterium]